MVSSRYGGHVGAKHVEKIYELDLHGFHNRGLEVTVSFRGYSRHGGHVGAKHVEKIYELDLQGFHNRTACL